jgi:hypothetical protein
MDSKKNFRFESKSFAFGTRRFVFESVENTGFGISDGEDFAEGALTDLRADKEATDDCTGSHQGRSWT